MKAHRLFMASFCGVSDNNIEHSFSILGKPNISYCDEANEMTSNNIKLNQIEIMINIFISIRFIRILYFIMYFEIALEYFFKCNFNQLVIFV